MLEISSMNKYQKITLFVVATVIFLMLLFPPFHMEIRSMTNNMGYGFILDPPKRGSLFSTVNAGMLLTQWVAVLLIGGLAFVFSKHINSPSSQSKHHVKVPSNKMENTKKVVKMSEYHLLIRILILTLGVLLIVVISEIIKVYTKMFAGIEIGGAISELILKALPAVWLMTWLGFFRSKKHNRNSQSAPQPSDDKWLS